MPTATDQQKFNPEDITNEQFLKTLFAELYPKVWVGCHTDPTGGFATSKLRWLNATTSCWFAGATIKPGSTSRSNPTADAGVVFVLDDVGTKLDFATADLAPTPTYIIETSPNNYQYGYKVSPAVNDMRVWGAFRELLKKTKFAGGADGSGLAAYWRLPNGGYHKDQHLPNDQRHDTRLKEWRPNLSYTLEDLARLFGFELSEDTIAQTKTTSQDAAAQVSDKELESDPGYQMFRDLGWLKSGQKDNGWIDVHCPNEHMHTKGVVSGAAYAVKAGANKTPDFKCHHTHCHGLRWKSESRPGIEELFFNDDAYKARYRKIIFSEIDEQDPETSGQIQDALPKDPQATQEKSLLQRLRENRKGYAKLYDQDDKFHAYDYDTRRPLPLYARPTIIPGLYRGQTKTLLAMPAAGKTAYSVSLAIAVAYERPDIIGETNLQRCGDVVLVANEDSEVEMRRKLLAHEKFWALNPADKKHKIWIIADGKVSVVSKTKDAVRPSCKEFLEFLVAISETSEIAVIVIDTLSSAMVGVNENDNGEMQQVMNILKRIADASFAGVPVIHHVSKAAGKEGNANMMAGRGASSVAGAVRSSTQLSPPSKTDLETYGWGNQEARAHVKLERVKGSYEANLGSVKWFKWEDVVLTGTDPWRPNTPDDQSVGILTPTVPAPAPMVAGHTPHDLQRRLRELEQYSLDGDETRIVRLYRPKSGGTGTAIADVWGLSETEAVAAARRLEEGGFLRIYKRRLPPHNNEANVVEIIPNVGEIDDF